MRQLYERSSRGWRNFNEKRMQSGISWKALPFNALGFYVRMFDSHPRDRIFSEDPYQVNRNKLVGGIAAAALAVITFVAIDSHLKEDPASKQTIECSVNALSSAGYSESNPPKLEIAKLLIEDCVQPDIRSSETVSVTAVDALEQMGIQVEFSLE